MVGRMPHDAANLNMNKSQVLSFYTSHLVESSHKSSAVFSWLVCTCEREIQLGFIGWFMLYDISLCWCTILLGERDLHLDIVLG